MEHQLALALTECAWHGAGMKTSLVSGWSMLMLLSVNTFAQQPAPAAPKSPAAVVVKPATQATPPKEDKGAPIPEDLEDDAHMREELGINEFTAPSISKLFETLSELGSLPEPKRKLDERMPLNRGDLAIELGFLIADGFLIVQSGQMDKVEPLAANLTRYGKALGAGDRINRHAASLLECAKNRQLEQLKKELTATQKDVEAELVTLRDSDLAHLISLGGWVRVLTIASDQVTQKFNPAHAKLIMREDIADYYADTLAGLEPRISQRPNFVEIRNVLTELRKEMVLGENGTPTVEGMKKIDAQAKRLTDLALQRQK